ncbi:MAG: hypothetical protein KKB50_18865, partial [Planctomycetes bacterium]|nr:hypothetical protein [Planctomycetota bacterium]
CLASCKLNELKGKTEIAVAMYTGWAWGAQTILTSNTILDRSPRVATSSDGTAMLTWVSNATNQEIGDPNNPNDIQYAGYDGSTWSTPANVATGVLSVVKSALAYKGSDAILLFTGDTDGSTQTPEDRELYGVSYSAGSWGSVTRLTNDSSPAVEDANPQVAYDNYGNPVIVWYRGGDLYFASQFNLGDKRVIVDLVGDSSGAADFRLATGANGQIALVWQETSPDRVDMWYAVYEPTLVTWSQPQRLTSDGSMEHALSPVYDAGGQLLAAYNKVQVQYETRTVYVNGQPVQIDNVPVPAQSDLYLLRHTVSGDLAISASDIEISPANPSPGSGAAITATVHNLGDATALSLAVAFYDGDPGAGGTLIGTSQNPGEQLVGGSQAEYAVAWTVPPSVEPREVFVVVDPGQIQEDRDRTNNSASVSVLAADLTITEISVQAAGPDRLLTIRVANDGVLPVTDVEVVLHRNSVSGPVLAEFSVPEILAGAYHDLSWRWEAPVGLGGVATIWAVADQDHLIGEFDEDNNARSAIVPVAPAGDIDGDGDWDMDDFAILAGCLAGPELEYPPDCDAADLDSDTDVDLADFAEFQVLFGGQ